MTVRIVFCGPAIAQHPEAVGTEQEQSFTDLLSMTDWVAIHVPETEREQIKLWINETPITGATLKSALLPLP